jgi:cupin fold WbuC family metalloprotein
MKIIDDKQNIIAYIVRKKDISKGKNFLTQNNEQMQFASFDLEKNEVIRNHIHNNTKREINTTSEGIVVIEGELKVKLFDNDKTFLSDHTLNSGDSILLLSGGHGIEVLENTKFVEFKQGPYIEALDKELF